MRYISGELIKSGAKFHHPASIIISGSSGLVIFVMRIYFFSKSFYLILNFRTGKTTFAYNLIKHQHFTQKIKNLHYFGCGAKYRSEKLDWHSTLKDVAVTYHGENYRRFYFYFNRKLLRFFADAWIFSNNRRKILRYY